MITRRWKIKDVEADRGFILGYSWWGWRCWRYLRHQYGITSIGPITVYWGRA